MCNELRHFRMCKSLGDLRGLYLGFRDIYAPATIAPARNANVEACINPILNPNPYPYPSGVPLEGGGASSAALHIEREPY